MTDERGVLRRIAWQELFPWLIIFRTFRLSISPTLLAVATLAVVLTYVGSWVGNIFLIQKVGEEWKVVPPPAPQLAAQTPPAVAKYLPQEPSSAMEGYFGLADPVFGIFRRKTTLHQAAYYVFVSLWTLAVWALAGGIITRRAVVEFGAEETPSFMETVRFAARRYLSYFLSPIYPLIGVMALMLPIAGLGLFARLTDLGVVLAGILWIFVVLAGLIAAWLLAGLLFGFPLMWGTVSAEREGDAFEAFSRSFSYVYARPLHYLFYAVVAALFGALCFALIDKGARLILEFGFWSYSWGAGGEKTAVISAWANLGFCPLYDLPVQPEQRTLKFGALLIALSVGLVRIITVGFIMSFFWCVAGAIYLLMRQDVDDKEMDEVYMPVEDPAPRPALEGAAAPPSPAETAPTPPATEATVPVNQKLIDTITVPPP